MRSLLFIGVALLLTISDVYGAIGVVEADKIKESNATPIETVNDGDVPIGCSGITFDGGNYVSPPDVKSAYCDPKNTIYKNRPFVKFFQSDTDGGDKNYLCCIVKNGVCGVSDILVDGDKSKNCNTNNECGDNNFCISDNNPEEVNMAGTFDTTLWKDMPLCCPKRDANQVCAVGDFVGDVTWEDCRKDLGRCWDNKGVCTWKGDKDATKSSCCSPPKKAVCPGEVLPYAVKTHKNNDVDIYDFRLNETLGFNYEDVEQSCIDLKEDSFVYDRKLCCPKYKMIMKGNLSFPVKHLKKDQFADLLLPKKVNLTSEEFKECGPGCKDEEWCAPVEVFNNAKHAKSLQKGSISLCYPKPLCPHPSKQVYPVKRVSGQVPEYSCSVETKECGDKGYCVLIDADAGTNAASFWENNSTLCCPRDQYDNPCSVEVGKRRNPLVDKPGAVLDVPGSNCTDNDNFTREWTPLNDGQGASSHKLCCEWKKPDAATLKKFESETCKSGGKLSITSGLFKKCPDGSADGIDCESSTGKCRPLKNNATVAACCIEDYCPHTGIPMSKTPDCDSDDCIYHRLTLQPLKEKHCKLDSSNKNKCCLPVPNCITESGKEHCGFNKIFPNNTQPQQLNDKCKDTVDCGGFGKYCNVTDKQCYFVPSSTIGKSLEKPCKKSDECKKEGAKFTFHCVMFKKTSEFGECLTFTKLVSTEHKANTGLVIGVIVLVVIGVVFLIAGLIMFLKYRSRNFCDRKKTDKTKAKRGKDTTTSNGTTGETTVGETIEGR